MATAMCTNCQREVTWSARRGCRLADQACPHCGEFTLQGKTTGRVSPHKGESYQVCVVCGRRKLGRSLVTVLTPVMLRYTREEYCAGSRMCRWHWPVPVNIVPVDGSADLVMTVVEEKRFHG